MGNCIPRVKLNVTIFNNYDEDYTFKKVKVFFNNENNIDDKISENNQRNKDSCIVIINEKNCSKDLEITYSNESLEKKTILYCRQYKRKSFVVEQQITTPPIKGTKTIKYDGELIIKCDLITHKIVHVKLEHYDGCF